MKENIKILHFLRGFAALGVVIFHYSTAALPTIKDNLLAPIFYYGQYGVQVFFVISGFVIPYSMHRSGYKINHYFKNILQRYVRICPPSYLSFLMIFAIYYGAILINHHPIEGMPWVGINTISVIGNLTYTVPYLKTEWFNPVFWTLAVEFQFYLIIGLLLPLLIKKNNVLIIIILIGALALWYVKIFWFFEYASFFVLGILLFLRKQKLIPPILFIVLSIITILFTYIQNNIPEFTFGTATYLIILLNQNLDFKFTNHLGKISYSLYIIHLPIGFIAEIVLKHILPIHHSDSGKIIMLLIYTIISILFATLFYKFIEKPFLDYSKKVKASIK